MKSALILLSITIAALLATAGPAAAADRGTFELTDVSQTASWSGELQAGPPVLPQACVPDLCDIVTVDVDLPAGVWAEPGGMLVATEPPPDFTNVNTFDLYVYGPDGQQVAKADSLWSVGSHAAWVENPVDGRYKIVVAPDAIAHPPARYDGFVSFDRGLTVKRDVLKEAMPYTQTFVAFGRTSPTPAEELLPDLIPTAPDNFHIAIGGVCIGFSLCGSDPQQPSCYPEETAGETSHEVPPKPGPQRCLRFDQGEFNFGDGPFELNMYPGKGNDPSKPDVYQRIFSSDGSVRHERVEGEARFHPNHGHFHYTGGSWWDIKMHERLPNGEPGAIVASFTDKGICPLDVANGRFRQRGDGPQGYGNDDVMTCMTPRYQDPNDPTFRNSPYIQAGISVGWTDIYPWFVLDQYIDITDVADGKYVIVTKQDPQGRLVEKSTANNTAMACVEIRGLEARACGPEPDLEVTSLAASNTKGVREGEKVTITATVANKGDGDAAGSGTEFLLDGSRMPDGLVATPPLKAGESVTLSLDWDTRGVKGEHTITATADSVRTVDESNEDNNSREITVSVRGNKVQNPSFEQSSNGSSPDSWSSAGASGYESGGSDGERSVSTGPGGSWTSEPVPIEAGAACEASVAAAGAGGTLLVQQLAADGSLLSSAAQPFSPSSAFTPTSLQLTALAGAAQARLVLLGGLTGTTSFDDVGLFSG